MLSGRNDRKVASASVAEGFRTRLHRLPQLVAADELVHMLLPHIRAPISQHVHQPDVNVPDRPWFQTVREFPVVDADPVAVVSECFRFGRWRQAGVQRPSWWFRLDVWQVSVVPHWRSPF